MERQGNQTPEVHKRLPRCQAVWLVNLVPPPPPDFGTLSTYGRHGGGVGRNAHVLKN